MKVHIIFYLLAVGATDTNSDFQLTLPTSLEVVSIKKENQLKSINLPKKSEVINKLEQIKPHLDTLKERNIFDYERQTPFNSIFILVKELYDTIQNTKMTNLHFERFPKPIFPIMDGIRRILSLVQILVSGSQNRHTRDKRSPSDDPPPTDDLPQYDPETTFFTIGLDGEIIEPWQITECRRRTADYKTCLRKIIPTIKKPLKENIGRDFINYVLRLKPSNVDHNFLAFIAGKLNFKYRAGQDKQQKLNRLKSVVNNRLDKGPNTLQREKTKERYLASRNTNDMDNSVLETSTTQTTEDTNREDTTTESETTVSTSEKPQTRNINFLKDHEDFQGSGDGDT